MAVNLHPYEHGIYCPAIYFQERQFTFEFGRFLQDLLVEIKQKL